MDAGFKQVCYKYRGKNIRDDNVQRGEKYAVERIALEGKEQGHAQ